MQKQYKEEKESVGVGAPADSEQEDYNSNSNIYKDVGTSSEDDLINTLKALVKIFDDFFGDLMKKPRNCDYIIISPNGSSRQGINQSFWTSFVRVIRRTYRGCRDCQESRGGV